jgi:hypothetical protein
VKVGFRNEYTGGSKYRDEYESEGEYDEDKD